MDIIMIFKGVSLAKCVVEYLGIIESISSKLDRLSKAEFESGIRALNQAAKSNCEQKSLLREARNRFNKAISLEKNERLVLCYLGLSLCHYHLKDYGNTKDTLKELLTVKIEDVELMKAIAIDTLKFTDPLFGVKMGIKMGGMLLGKNDIDIDLLPSHTSLKLRKNKLKEIQESVKITIESL